METKTEMKEMVYGGNDGCLYHEIDSDGFGIMVLNIRGSHPCAYVTFPGIEKIEDYDDVELESDEYLPHGGFTYLGERDNYNPDNRIWLGWDYAHWGDYVYTVTETDWERRWTTDEIVSEAKKVLELIKNGKIKF